MIPINLISIIICCLILQSNSINYLTQKRVSFWKKPCQVLVSYALLFCPSVTNAIETPISDCITESNPQITTQFCRKLGLVKGRLRGCDANENCISTSAKSASKYSPPWTYNFLLEKDPTYDPWEPLITAILSEGLTIIKADKPTHYILAGETNVPNQPSGASLFYEFLVRDGKGDKIILYRAVVDKTIFVYPLQQPISDFGALSKKLQSVLNEAGWLQIGE